MPEWLQPKWDTYFYLLIRVFLSQTFRNDPDLGPTLGFISSPYAYDSWPTSMPAQIVLALPSIFSSGLSLYTYFWGVNTGNGLHWK